MAVITLAELKEYLGLPPGADPELDPKLNNAILNGQALVEAYIGGPLEVTVQQFEAFNIEYREWLYLPHRPLAGLPADVTVTKDGTLVPTTDYRLAVRDGALVFDRRCCGANFGCCPPWAEHLLVAYKSGWAVLPADLKAALLNITAAIYGLGGTFAESSAATGALKSLTMFDAMSMSFETGDSSSSESGSTPKGLLSQWAFVLDKYKMNEPVLA